MTTQTSINERPPVAALPPPTGQGWCEAAMGSDPDSRLRADVALLAPVLAGRRDELAESMAQGLTGAVGAYHLLPAREAIRRDYVTHLDALTRAPGLPAHQQAGTIRTVAAAHGRSGADDGTPLAMLVEFYRVGLRVLWEVVLQACGERRCAERRAGRRCLDGLEAAGRVGPGDDQRLPERVAGDDRVPRAGEVRPGRDSARRARP